VKDEDKTIKMMSNPSDIASISFHGKLVLIKEHFSTKNQIGYSFILTPLTI
jgi:hypothetical protein